MKRCFHRYGAALASAALLILPGCGSSGSSGVIPDGVAGGSAQQAFARSYNASDTWVVYWYLCGTDLESEMGAASLDIEELQQVKLPPNVKVVIQTGGAKEWHTDGVPANETARFLFDEHGLQKLSTTKDVNMGSGEALADFLRFGKDNFQADHRIFVFWDHGGGSIGGICYDERYDEMMSLNELRQAFASVYEANAAEPPFELIGFDACLMATVDTLGSIHGFSRYMVASQEQEPGCGWDYSEWVGALAKDTSMGGASLGKIICDSFLKGCAEYEVADQATLSLADVTKAPALLSAYGSHGTEALQVASRDSRRFFSKFSRGADASENYGGNSFWQGYFDMVDLGDLVRNTQEPLPASSAPLLAALDDCVLYKVHGIYRPKASGLSCYYSYDGDADVWRAYADLETPPMPVKCLYYYLLFGDLPEEAQPYLSGAETYAFTSPETSAPMQSAGSAPAAATNAVYNVAALEDTPVDVDKDGAAYVRLSQEAMDLITSVHCQLIYMSEENNIMICLGSDSNVNADWERGIFSDNFFGKWPMLDGHPVYVEITQEGDGFNLYSVPIKLNGTPCSLQIVYDFKTEKYRILGARKKEDAGKANLASSRDLIKLKEGDTVTTIHYVQPLDGNGELTEVDVDTFTLGKDPVFEDDEVGDGTYGYFFEFVDPLNRSALSDMVTYTIQNGQITTYVDTPGAPGGFAETGYGADPGLLTSAPVGASEGGSIAERMTGGGDPGASQGSAPSGGSIAESLAR